MDTVNLVFHITGGLINFYLNPFAKRVSKLTRPDYEAIRDIFGWDFTKLKIQIDN